VKLQKLAKEIETFAKNKKLDKQLNHWAVFNKAEEKLNKLEAKLTQDAAAFDKKNGIEKFAKEHASEV